MSISFNAIPSKAAAAYRGGALDAYGRAPERAISDGDGVPCRHCLRNVDAGEPYLIVAHRPFEGLNPYTKTGPIFLHAEPCERAAEGASIPAILSSDSYILRGYSADERIVYGTGGVVATGDIPVRAADLLARPDVVHVDVRSAANNCYQCRIEPT